MNGASSTARALDLLTERVTIGLDRRHHAELEELLEGEPGIDPESWELAAAAIDLAHAELDEPLPQALRERVLRQATAGARVLTFPTASTPRRGALTTWSGWLAAAAVLALAFVGGVPQWLRPTPSVVEQRAQLLADGGAVEIAWSPGGDPAGEIVAGDVVWNNARQRGFLRFQGLAINDPTAWQYQLWIFDKTQSPDHPIDGGVFDVTADGEVVVEIDPKLRVVEPTLFAVTIEKPGGVVVSSRERLVLLATV